MQEKKRPYKDTLFFGVRYDGVVMDPPSYGRGPGGEVWKLEDSVYELVRTCAQVPTVTERIYCMTDGESPVVYEFSRKNRASSESTCAQVRTSS